MINNLDNTIIDKLNKESWDLSRIDDKRSLELALEAEIESLKNNYLYGLATSYLNQGWYYLNITHYVSSNSLFQQAKELYFEIDNIEGILKANAGLSGVAFHIGDYELCLNLNSDTIEKSIDIGNIDRQITALISTAQVYLELDNYEKAIHYSLEALEIAKELENYDQKGILLKALADSYIGKNDYENAIKYSALAYEYYLINNQYQGIFETTNTLGTLFFKKGEINKAEDYLLKSYSLAKGYPWEEVVVYSLAEFYFFQNNYKKSLKYLLECKDIAQNVKSKNYLKKVYYLKSKLEEKLSDIEGAYKSLKKYLKYKNEIDQDKIESQHQKLDIRLEINKVKRENVHLLESNEILKRIGQIGQKITGTLEAEQILNIIYQSIKDLMDASTFGLAYYYQEDELLDYKIFIEDSKKLPMGKTHINDPNSIACWSIRNRQDIFITDLEKEYAKYINKLGPIGDLTRSLIFLPLYYDNKVIALLSIQSKKINAYSKRQIEVLMLLRSYVTIAVQNSIEHNKALKLNKELEKVSLTDSLTTLYNRRYFNKVIESDVNLILRSTFKNNKRKNSKQLGFILLDIDHFKDVNDRYGHPAGDDILKQVSKCLLGTIRKSDLLVRWGGEEFLILAKETDYIGIQVIISKLLKAISSKTFIHDNITLNKTISIGFSIFPFDVNKPNAVTWEKSLKITDKALYIAKETGRNRGVGICLGTDGEIDFNKEVETLIQEGSLKTLFVNN